VEKEAAGDKPDHPLHQWLALRHRAGVWLLSVDEFQRTDLSPVRVNANFFEKAQRHLV
jgi:hypothetical protein